MAELVSVREAISVAIQMEGNAAAFYRRVAARHAGGHVKEIDALAAMEDEHKAAFVKMRDRLTEASQELSGEGGLYLTAASGGLRVEGSPAAADALTGREDLADILLLAVDLEKDAILFYLGLRDVLTSAPGRKALDGIIAEEKQHIVMLSRRLLGLTRKTV